MSTEALEGYQVCNLLSNSLGKVCVCVRVRVKRRNKFECPAASHGAGIHPSLRAVRQLSVVGLGWADLSLVISGFSHPRGRSTRL